MNNFKKSEVGKLSLYIKPGFSVHSFIFIQSGDDGVHSLLMHSATVDPCKRNPLKQLYSMFSPHSITL